MAVSFCVKAVAIASTSIVPHRRLRRFPAIARLTTFLHARSVEICRFQSPERRTSHSTRPETARRLAVARWVGGRRVSAGVHARGNDTPAGATMQTHRSTWPVLVTVLLALLLASCAATQPPTIPLIDAPGFWKGLWHGFIAPVTFIISLFSGGILAGSRRRT